MAIKRKSPSFKKEKNSCSAIIQYFSRCFEMERNRMRNSIQCCADANRHLYQLYLRAVKINNLHDSWPWQCAVCTRRLDKPYMLVLIYARSAEKCMPSYFSGYFLFGSRNFRIEVQNLRDSLRASGVGTQDIVLTFKSIRMRSVFFAHLSRCFRCAHTFFILN